MILANKDLKQLLQIIQWQKSGTLWIDAKQNKKEYILEIKHSIWKFIGQDE